MKIFDILLKFGWKWWNEMKQNLILWDIVVWWKLLWGDNRKSFFVGIIWFISEFPQFSSFLSGLFSPLVFVQVSCHIIKKTLWFIPWTIKSSGSCDFPSSWLGSWFESGFAYPIEITSSTLTHKGECMQRGKGEGQIIFKDRLDICYPILH